MQGKTEIQAPEGRQEIIITRNFELSVDELFEAYTDASVIEEWMGTKVLKLQSEKQGGYRFETTDPKGGKHYFSGTIHDFVPGEKIVRTFEMENTAFSPQLEFLSFESTGETASRLYMHVIYKSIEERDAILRLPFAQGINMAHNRLEDFQKNKGGKR